MKTAYDDFVNEHEAFLAGVMAMASTLGISKPVQCRNCEGPVFMDIRRGGMKINLDGSKHVCVPKKESQP